MSSWKAWVQRPNCLIKSGGRRKHFYLRVEKLAKKGIPIMILNHYLEKDLKIVGWRLCLTVCKLKCLHKLKLPYF